MRIPVDLFILFFYIIVRLVSSKHIMVKNNTNQLGPSPSLRLNYRRFDKAAHPQPLPTPPPKKIEISPYTTIYQGLRYKDDVRVFRKRFEYPPMLNGQQIVSQGLFDCIISHISIESTEAIPVLLRGGAGYRHFTVVVKSKAYHELKGQIRAYCRNKYEPLEGSDKNKNMPQRRFNFGDQVQENSST